MDKIIVTNICRNNLKNVSVKIEKGSFVVLVGKSGSGKSTLAVDVIFSAYFQKIKGVSTFGTAALFEQNYGNGKQDENVQQYLYGKDISVNENEIIGSNIRKPEIGILKKDDLKNIAMMLGVDKIPLSRQIRHLSTSVYRKIRFLKILLTKNVDVLIVDELAAGMSYSEAIAIGEIFCFLVAKGITVLAIEHSLPIIMKSDYVIELGPGAGIEGGKILFSGSFAQYSYTKNWEKVISESSRTLVKKNINFGKYLTISKIKVNGLSNLNVKFPIGCIVNVFGKAASGKTTLLNVLFQVLDKTPDAWKRRQEIDVEVCGKDYIRRAHVIEQSPIGKNAFSTPATYSGIMDSLRKLYAENADGYEVSDFSYRGKHKCPICEGRGYIPIIVDDMELQYMCTSCNGKRYDDEILKISNCGMSIGKLLTTPCDKVLKVYENEKPKASVVQKMRFIKDVGLSYICLGQSSSSLSGGESQRLKITKELSKKLGDRSVFILDNPTLGLNVMNYADLINVLRMLVEKNNSVIISDNTPFMIRNSDFVILLDNGKLVYQGEPNELPLKYLKEFGL